MYRPGDIILIARTGYGKSTVLQAMSVIMEGRITVKSIPFKSWEDPRVDREHTWYPASAYFEPDSQGKCSKVNLDWILIAKNLCY